jgi:hypothetical protein
MTLDESKLDILRRVEEGKLTIEEGAHLLEILERGAEAQQASAVIAAPEAYVPAGAVNAVFTPRKSTEKLEIPAGWRALWGIVLWLGVAFLSLSGYWLYSSYARSGMGVGFWFALFFLLLSMAIIFLGWQITASRWALIRFHGHDEEKEKEFDLWAPLPFNIARWFFRTFGASLSDSVKFQNMEEIFDEMEKSMEPGEPFVIDLEGEKGSQANINIEF